MMCIIRIKDGVPFEHPIMLDNFEQAFPEIDLNNLPEGFAWFDRTERPAISQDEVFLSLDSRYELRNGVWTDVRDVRDKTYEEKIAENKAQLQQTLNIAITVEAEAVDEQVKAAWQQHIDEITAVLSAVPFVISYPMPPRMTDNGKLYLSQTPGSEPDVIG